MRLIFCFLLIATGCRARHDAPQSPAGTSAPGIPRALFILGAVMGGKDRGYLLTDAPATTDSLLWTVPVGFITGFGPLSSDQVRLRIEDADSSARWAEAGPFTITGVPPHGETD